MSRYFIYIHKTLVMKEMEKLGRKLRGSWPSSVVCWGVRVVLEFIYLFKTLKYHVYESSLL